MNYLRFSDSHINGLQICMAMFAGVAALIGAGMVWEGQTSVALTNFCGALFFVFAYHNPDILLVNESNDARSEQTDVYQQKFLWTSLAIGVLAVVVEFKEHLPLG